MNKEHLDKIVAEMRERLAKPDPLEQRGIPKDHVCVISPRIEYELRKIHQQKVGQEQPLLWIGWLKQYTGRNTFVDHRAPMGELQYMPLDTYYELYPPLPLPSYMDEDDEPNP